MSRTVKLELGINGALITRRWGEPENWMLLTRGCEYEDVANVMVFLCSEESSYMTGQAINVTGGQEMR